MKYWKTRKKTTRYRTGNTTRNTYMGLNGVGTEENSFHIMAQQKGMIF
jgi:hypothetical protein